MTIDKRICRLRAAAGMTQEQLATVLEVSHQAVQKWESGASTPDLGNVVKLAKFFHVTVDSILFESDQRILEEMQHEKRPIPDLSKLSAWDVYSSDLAVDFQQSLDEGLDVECYRELFEAVSRMPVGEYRERIADVLFEMTRHAGMRENFEFVEPSTLSEIRALRKPYAITPTAMKCSDRKKKLLGAWTGRACGCLLGKPIEGIRTHELHPLLREIENYPLHRYLRSTDITEEMCSRYRYRLAGKTSYADLTDGMPVDDDTNYTVLAQRIVEKYGRDFTPANVAKEWLSSQSVYAYCTAERVAFHNFLKGYQPPQSAIYKNPYREYIGAQIRGDYFGYINPGNPEAAAEMAFRDASISHIKNGIYGEMFIAAVLAAAAVTDSMEDMILSGLSQIPETSRLYRSVLEVLQGYSMGVTRAECFARIHRDYDEKTEYGWCHTIPNAMIVTASLLYGGGDFGRSICMAVETGFDTDCNGATVGSILGMRNGIDAIGEEWTKPLNGKINTSIFGVGTVSIAACAELTEKHIKE